MKLFKMCAQNKRGPAFQFFIINNIVGLILHYKKFVFKAIGKRMKYESEICVQNKRGLLFSLLNYLHNTKNMCLKKKDAGFQFIKLRLLRYFYNSEICVFKSSRKLHFNLFSYICNSETCVFKSSERLLFSLFSYFCNSESCPFKSNRRLLFSLFDSVFFSQKNSEVLIQRNNFPVCACY